MESFIRETLIKQGDTSRITSLTPVSGGDINQSFYVETEKRSYFIKCNENVASHFFEIEAEGLNLIRNTEAIKVPEVYHYDTPQEGERAALVMEWIDPGLNPSAAASKFGHQLAEMHKNTSEKYGYGKPTFVAELDQNNEWCSTWTSYYSHYRLGEQLEIGVSKGTIKGHRQERLEKLIKRLTNLIPGRPEASLLHGDLWGGNWMIDRRDNPVLIDPSILYGDHAFELAFTELFGGFPHTFYDAYNAHYPLPDYYEDTKPVYQLFYLLVHLNTFGESYGPGVDRILKHYVG